MKGVMHDYNLEEIMKFDKNTKMGLIGFGFLLEYLYPCYKRFYDPNTLKNNVKAVTADEKNIDRKREKYPFEIILNDNLAMLKDLQPDIILFAPPPSVAAKIAENELLPYFIFCREQNIKLPDLYAFPPSPQWQFYLDLLGEDIHTCNILPNMMNEINGKSLNGMEGNTYITYPEKREWDKPRKERIEEFFGHIGNVLEVKTEHVLDMLGTLATHETISFLAFDIADALGFHHKEMTYDIIAETLRACHQKECSYYPKGSAPCCMDKVDAEFATILTQIVTSWKEGAIAYLCDAGMDIETAISITVSLIDINLHGCQVQSREYTEKELKNHATPAGVAERAKMCYELLMRSKIKKQFANGLKDMSPQVFCQWIKMVIYEISKIVAIHGRRLGGSDYGLQFTPETQAMLYGIFVRNILELCPSDGATVVQKATALYAKQRGTRMAKRAFAHGDENTMIHYHVYGEWEAAEDEMQSYDYQLEPTYVTRVTKCPWYTCWEKYGYLEEGKEYCRNIDKMLVQSYNNELNLDVNAIRTFGDDYCEFGWNQVKMDQKMQAYLHDKRSKIGKTAKKNWLYHTTHIYSAMKQTLADVENYEYIVSKSMQDFETIFGAAMRQELENNIEDNYFDI